MPDAVATRIALNSAPNREAEAPLQPAPPIRVTFVDLVCHGTVPVMPATRRSRWGEDVFYFCSPVCQQRFASDPEAFLPRRDSFDESTRRDGDYAAA